ncbi:hypothetical protein CA234_10780 [Sphingomonas sp. ABOLE]|uniref:phage virion morphogenesis protein n=1 Tax=Sphingomonas sp. ABOLE TaxID=1985878 RepID=UPI000F7E839D|nr:phage virion morphogenesis protein [Sphingomonas sp. ABOLE]RSV40882.1 hypothetical protein CA234_10780 [Sphingomonas sp. ABOLE]
MLMKSWARQGKLCTGFDVEASGMPRDVAARIPLEPEEQNKGAGKYRRTAMFRKLRKGRNLRAGATDREAWIDFAGRASEIASVSQEGLMDRPSATAKPVRYARRH